MRFLKKLGIFLELKKDEIKEWLEDWAPLILAGLGVFIILCIAFFGVGYILGIIAVQFYSITEWVSLLNLDPKAVDSVMSLGVSLTLVVYMVLSIGILCILLIYGLGKWLYANWKLAEEKLQEDEN